MGFLAPRQAGRPGEPRSDQSEDEFGSALAFIYTHNREMGGGPLLVEKGGGPLHIHTIERWEGAQLPVWEGEPEGCHVWSKKGGGFGLFLGFFGSQTSRTSRGRAQNKMAAPHSCLYEGIGSTCASEVSE